MYRFIAGLGGRDITPETFEEVIDITLKEEHKPSRTYWVGVKGGTYAI